MTTILFETPGPAERRKTLGWTAAVAVLALAGVGWVLMTLADAGVLDGEIWAVLSRGDLLVALLHGILSTLQVAAFTIVLSLGLGLILALGRMSRATWIRVPARAWIEVLRGLPELLLIFFIYLGVPAVTGFNISTFWALVVGLVLYESTSMAEVFRGGFQALPKGQTEAAHALGLRTAKTLRFILLPQVVRQVLPSLVSEMVRVTKASSLGFVVGYTDLLLRGELAIEYLGGEYAAPVFTLVAILYVVICVGLGRFSQFLTDRLR